MMNSSEICAFIDKIAATSGKIDKQALVSEGLASSDLFKRVCDYAYNPFKTYGIRQIPDFVSDGDNLSFDLKTWGMLDNLISRDLTGGLAQISLKQHLERLDPKSAELLVRIIRKDLRAGFSESTINKGCKGLIPDFPYMRCSLPKDAKLEQWPWSEGVISQEKADGMFANVDHYENGEVAIRSRQGSEFPIDKFDRIVTDVQTRTMPGYQLHGEVLVKRGGKILDREISNGILNSVLSGGDFDEDEEPFYMIWDQIPLEFIVTKGKYQKSYNYRLTNLIRQLKVTPGTAISLIPTRVVKTMRDAYAHAAELMKNGKEGTVIKHPNAIWKDGTSKEQIKIKLEFEVDLQIINVVPGRAGTKNEGRAGSLTCATEDGELVVDVTVKNEAMRDLVDANPDDWIGKIIAVVANDIMEPSASNTKHSLFLPRMSEAAYRTDKFRPDSLKRVFDQKEAAIFGQKVKKEAA